MYSNFKCLCKTIRGRREAKIIDKIIKIDIPNVDLVNICFKD